MDYSIGDEFSFGSELEPFDLGRAAAGADRSWRHHYVLATDASNSHQLAVCDLFIEFLDRGR